MIAMTNYHLAEAVRAVNAQLARTEDPDDAKLRDLWSQVRSDLDVAEAMGDDMAAKKAIDRYRIESLAVLNGK